MTTFHWPDGRRCALSISFDDAKPSQMTHGLPILNAHGVKATFFVLMPEVRRAEALWRSALARGHELGNHTRLHPCSGNFGFARANPLEDYTLERMEDELVAMNTEIAAFSGRIPASFAYCCGQKFVGRGEATRSYVPVVARHFQVGRGFRDEYANDPTFVDLAQVGGTDADGASFEQMRAWLDAAIAQGQWLVLVGHDVGDSGSQMVRTAELDRLLEYVATRPEVWTDTMGAVGAHVASMRAEASGRLAGSVG